MLIRLIMLFTCFALPGIAPGAPDAEAVARQPVRVTRERVTLPWYTSVRHGEGLAKLPHHLPFPSQLRPMGHRTVEGLWLENEYLRVLVAPQLGGVVLRAIDKATGEDIFYREGRIKDARPFWESGVKLLFPSAHHTVSTDDQPAGYRIYHTPDGGAGVAMWMEFSRFNQPREISFHGRYSTMIVSQHVSLSPDRAALNVSYRLYNPSPYRQGRKLWAAAYFPRTHTAAGASHGIDSNTPKPTQTQLVLPAERVSEHRGRNARAFDRDAAAVGSATDKADRIVNSLTVRHGFAGLWYPAVKVNRLRVTDPSVAPGARFYFRGEGHVGPEPPAAGASLYNFVELFGSFDHLMHGSETWLGPGEVASFTHRYLYIKGIGKADYANTDAAVHVDIDGRRVEAVTTRAVDALQASWEGRALGKAQACGPGRPAHFALPEGARAGRLELRGDGRVLLSQAFPLELKTDLDHEAQVRSSVAVHPPETAAQLAAVERYGDQGDWGGYLQLLEAYPADSLERGRVQLRAGLIDESIKTLRNVTKAQPGEGEAWHLLGVALLEDENPDAAGAAFERAVAAEAPYPAARYFLALRELRSGQTKAALAQLEQLVAASPKHWEGRLLGAWVAGQNQATRGQALKVLKAMRAQDPADPRVAMVLAAVAEQAGRAALAAEAGEALAQLVSEPGAWRRVREFNGAIHGFYVPARRVPVESEIIQRRAGEGASN